MAQTYTLDEAAGRLGMATEEFKRRLKDEWKSIRSFRDGATLRFRAADIDELARSLGQASDPGLQLGAPGAAPQTGSSEEFLLADAPTHGHDEHALGAQDIFSLAAGDSGRTKKPKASDSDVRLEISHRPTDDPENKAPTEEIALDLSGPGSSKSKAGSSSAKLTAPKSGPNLAGPGSSNRIPGPPASSEPIANTDSSSEFELSLDADSGSFELQLNSDSSEEVPLGAPDASASGSRSGQSGINLAKPADSGVSLEKNKPGGPPDDDSDDFELSLDPSDAGLPKGSTGSPRSRQFPAHSAEDDISLDPSLGGMPGSSHMIPPKSRQFPAQPDDSDSEFELSLDDNSGVSDNLAAELGQEADKGDIFETDFELPAVQDDADSGSEVVAIESADTDLENSDFDLALDEADAPAADESESQVVLLDDEHAPAVTPSGRRLGAAAVGAAAGAAAGAAVGRSRRAAADEFEEESASSALRGVAREEDEEQAVPRGVAPPAKWGPLPAIVLIPCFLFTFLGGIMSFELLRGMWGYNQGTKPGGTIVRGFASMLDMDPKD